MLVAADNALIKHMKRRLFLSILFFAATVYTFHSVSASQPPWAGDNIVHIHDESLVLSAGNPYVDNTSFFMNNGRISLSNTINQSFGRLLLQNSVNTFDLGGTSSVVTFDLVTGGSGSLNLVNYNYSSNPTLGGPQFRIADRSGDALSYVTINGLPASYYGDTNILIATSAVPEPSTYALMAGLAVGGMAYWRKRRKTVD